jgi:hypothetical protein
LAPSHGNAIPANADLDTPNPLIEGFEAVDLSIALSMAIRDLDREDLKLLLRDELRKDQAYRLELSTFGNARAFEQLQAAFKANGVRFLVDQQAQARLKNSKVKTDFVVYSEALTADNLTRILELLAKRGPGSKAKKRDDGPFNKVIILPLNSSDRKEMAGLLGVDPSRLHLPRTKAPVDVDVRKPVADDTASQVVQSLDGQGRPRPDASKGTTQIPERLAILVPYNPVRSKPTASKEIKDFLDRRKDPLPGTIQVLLVLREATSRETPVGGALKSP